MWKRIRCVYVICTQLRHELAIKSAMQSRLLQLQRAALDIFIDATKSKTSKPKKKKMVAFNFSPVATKVPIKAA